MQRSFHRIALATALALATGGVAAQDFVFGFNPRSGDVWVDTTLGDMNRYGSRYRDPFIDEMVRYHGAPRDLVGELLDRRWAPGDVYMACNIAAIIGRPCRYVAEQWETHHAEGWGAMAKRLGIKPGSAQFHRMKNGFVPTYDRWGRTIVLDDDLRRAYPDRARKGGKASPAGKAVKSGGHVHDGGAKGHGQHDKGPGRAAAGPAKSQGGKGNATAKGGGKVNGNGKGKKD